MFSKTEAADGGSAGVSFSKLKNDGFNKRQQGRDRKTSYANKILKI